MNLRASRGRFPLVSSARRADAVLAVVLVGAISFVGCGSNGNRAGSDVHTTGGASTSSAAGGQFAVGDCWQEVDYSAAVQWLTWEGSDQVDCHSGHNSITFAAPTLAEDFPYPVDGDGALMEPTDEASAVVGFACRSLAQDLLPSGAPEASMVGVMWYLPTVEQWNEGQRHVRCDLTLRSFDATWSEAEMRAMPATLAELTTAQHSDPLAYEACALTEQGVAVGPVADPTTTQLVRCDGPHTWRWLEGSEMPAPADAPFPGDAAIEVAYTTLCSNALSVDQAWWAFAPDAATWTAGDRSIDCWIGNDYLTL